MRLEQVKPAALPVKVRCLKCERTVEIADNRPGVWADLDGPAFEAYYCEPCVKAFKHVRFDPLPSPIPPCCETARAAGYRALPSIRANLAPAPEAWGYVLECAACPCPSRWVPHDWRKGHAAFEQAKKGGPAV
jgi:hypothetical protein